MDHVRPVAAARADCQVGYRQAAQLAQRWVKEYDIDDLDVEAVVTILVGAIVNYRRTQWTFGGAPLEVGEDRFVDAVLREVREDVLEERAVRDRHQLLLLVERERTQARAEPAD